MLVPEKKSKQLPRWVEWIFAALAVVASVLEFVHREIFWGSFFSVVAVVLTLMAAGVLGRVKGDSDGG